jgi:hypothetical protein
MHPCIISNLVESMKEFSYKIGFKKLEEQTFALLSITVARRGTLVKLAAV